MSVSRPDSTIFHVGNYMGKCCPSQLKTIGLTHSMFFKNQLHIFTSLFFIQTSWLAPQSHKVMGLALRKVSVNPRWTHQSFMLSRSTLQLAFVFDHHCHLRYDHVAHASFQFKYGSHGEEFMKEVRVLQVYFTELDVSSRTVLFNIMGSCGYGACEISLIVMRCALSAKHTQGFGPLV